MSTFLLLLVFTHAFLIDLCMATQEVEEAENSDLNPLMKLDPNTEESVGSGKWYCTVGPHGVYRYKNVDDAKDKLCQLRGSKAVFEVNACVLNGDPHNIRSSSGGKQGDGQRAGWCKWWWAWPDIHRMANIARNSEQCIPKSCSSSTCEYNQVPMYNGHYFRDTDGGNFPEMTATNVCKFLGYDKASNQPEQQGKDSYRVHGTKFVHPAENCSCRGPHNPTCNLVTQNGVSFCVMTYGEVDDEPVWNTIRCERGCHEAFSWEASCNTASCAVEKVIKQWPGGKVRVETRGDFGAWHETATIKANGNVLRVCQGGTEDCKRQYFDCGTFEIGATAQLTFHIDSSDSVNYCKTHMEIKAHFIPKNGKESDSLAPGSWKVCGNKRFPNGGRAFHCKTNSHNPTKEWCRQYARRTKGAIGLTWARLYGWQGHCTIFFDKTVRSCPSGISWYQNYYKGEDFERDGTCSSENGSPNYFEYKISTHAAESSVGALEFLASQKFVHGSFVVKYWHIFVLIGIFVLAAVGIRNIIYVHMIAKGDQVDTEFGDILLSEEILLS